MATLCALFLEFGGDVAYFFSTTGQGLGVLAILGTIGLLINCIIVSILTVVLSLPIATRRIQILFLTWLVAVLYIGNNPNPYLAIVRLPIAPIAVCYSLGTTAIGWYEIAMVIVAIGYIAGLIWLAGYWFARRDLIFS